MAVLVASGNGGHLRRTFAAELGSPAPDGEGDYRVRMRCTRCYPERLGTIYSLSKLLAVDPTISRGAAVEKLQDLARIDVLRHCDGFHQGRT